MRATGTRARVISRVAWRPGGPRGRGQGPVGEVGGGGRGGRGEGRAAEAGRETAPVRADVGRPAGTRRFRERASSIVRRQCRLPWRQAGREPVRAGPQTVSRFQVGPGGRCGGGCGDLTLMRASAMALFVFLCWNFTCTDTLFIDELYINLVVVSKEYNSIFRPYYFFLEFD